MKSNFKKILAFSLVELMVTILTIAAVSAAFTPVITKKLQTNSNAINAQNKSNKCGVGCATCKVEGSKICLSCIENYYFDNGKCIPCAEGKGTTPGNNKSGFCKCKPGFYGVSCSSECHTACATCNGGTANDCLTCNTNYYNSTGITAPNSNITCSACKNLGTTPYGNRTNSCQCTKWHTENDCSGRINCKPGEYFEFSDVSESVQGCKPCPAGRYSTTTTAVRSCTSCLPGQYQPLKGQISCKPCDSNCSSTCDNITGTCTCKVGYVAYQQGYGTQCVEESKIP